MERIFTIAGHYLISLLILALGSSFYGCSDSATVNPVVELANLTVTPGTLQPNFSGGTTQYQVDLANNVPNVTISAQPAVSGDSVTINGEATASRSIDLGEAGTTTPVNIVVSESGTNSRTYTVLLKRADLAGNNSLQNLTVSPGTPPIDFNENNLSYTVSVANSVNSVTVTPTLQDLAATMTVNGQPATSGQARTINLNPAGQSTNITILVKAQDQTEKPYTIMVSRGVSNNNNLQSLTLSPGTLDFRPADTSYTENVASNVTSVVVTPRLQDTTASLTVNGQATNSGQGRTIQLGDPGSNTPIFVIVTAQNGAQKTYTIGVIRAALSGNNNLQSLNVSQGSLNPTFSANRTSYSVNVGGRVDSIVVTAAPVDTSTRMTINGQSTNSGQARSIDLGPDGSSTEIQIIVTADNGSQKPYFITVNRALLSSDNNLETLTVSPGDLDPAFAPGTPAYMVEVATGVTSVTVTATKSDSNAVISGDVPNGGQATIPLDGPGTTKNISITVTAPKGNVKTYTVAVTRRPPSSNNNLSVLTVTPGNLSPGFSSNTLNYEVSSSAGSLSVSATKADPDAVMSGSVAAGTGVPTGSATISLGGPGTITRISIIVTAPNGVSRTYTITASRPFR